MSIRKERINEAVEKLAIARQVFLAEKEVFDGKKKLYGGPRKTPEELERMPGEEVKA